jgi:hypothetical protein
VLENDLYKLGILTIMDKQVAIPTIFQWNKVDLLHHLLHHISQNQMKQLHDNNMVKGLESCDVKILSPYKACLLGKKHRKNLMK